MIHGRGEDRILGSEEQSLVMCSNVDLTNHRIDRITNLPDVLCICVTQRTTTARHFGRDESAQTLANKTNKLIAHRPYDPEATFSSLTMAHLGR